MKILNSKQPSMDNKLKFSDRFKLSHLQNSDTQKGIDPYVFNDTEQPFVVSTGGKNIKLIAPKNSKIPNSNRNKSKGKCLKTTKIKTEPVPSSGPKSEPGTDVDGNAAKHLHQSHQLALQQKQRHLKNLQRLRAKRRCRDHTLQYYPRAGDEISDSELSEDELQTYQRHWYSGELDPTALRASRLAQLHSQLQRQLRQLQTEDDELKASLKQKTRCLLEAAVRDPTTTARILGDDSRSLSAAKIADGPLVLGGPCGADGCQQTSLPCTRHCSRHIMLNGDQLLFEHCTAKFSDNTQCCIPVFDVAHELPLCPEHARKRDNYHRRAQESKPKKPRSKKPSSPSAGSAASTTPGATTTTTTTTTTTIATTTTPAAAAVASSKPSKPKSRPSKKRKRPPSSSAASSSSSKQQLEIKAAAAVPAVVQQAPVPVAAPIIAPHTHHVNIPAVAVTAAAQQHHHQLMPDENHYTSPIIASNANDIHTKTLNNLNALPPHHHHHQHHQQHHHQHHQQHQQQHHQQQQHHHHHHHHHAVASNAVTNLNNLGLVDIGSLGLGGGLKVELDDHEVFASLDHTSEHDFENVLNNLPADAFNDLFIEGRNGEYEPSREEEEELERAVEAFDKDVRNLERMGQTHGLLEPALLAQLMSDMAS